MANYRVNSYEPVIGTNGAVAQNGTQYSGIIDMRNSYNSTVAVLLTSSAGSITVTQQCSWDGTTFFDPVNAAGAVIGTVGTALTAISAGKYIMYTPVLTKYARYKVVENNSAATTVTIAVMLQE